VGQSFLVDGGLSGAARRLHPFEPIMNPIRRLVALFSLVALPTATACAPPEEELSEDTAAAALSDDEDCNRDVERMRGAYSMAEWEKVQGTAGFQPALPANHARTAMWMAWLSGVTYSDDFGRTLQAPGYMFRCGFHKMGYGHNSPSTFKLTAGDRKVEFRYKNEGELWWNAGIKLKELEGGCGKIVPGNTACAMRDKLEKHLFTELPKGRSLGKLHGQVINIGKPDSPFQQGTTQAFFLHDPNKAYAVVVFRGTQFTLRADRMVDLNVLPVQFLNGSRVHRGFNYALNEPTDSEKSVSTLLRERLRQLPQNTKVYVAGHSLGGALATLFTAQLALEQSVPYNVEGLYTFGSPSVGDTRFGEQLNAGLAKMGAWHGRFHRGSDFVVRSTDLIPSSPYAHNTGASNAGKNAVGVNLYCDPTKDRGFAVTDTQRPLFCDGPILGDHNFEKYYTSLRDILSNHSGNVLIQ
jgi:hypothetical protein